MATAIMERGNVVLRVSDDQIERYLNLGYRQTDGKGNIIKDTIPTDINTLKKAYTENKATIEKLEAEIAQLKAKSTKKTSIKQ